MPELMGREKGRKLERNVVKQMESKKGKEDAAHGTMMHSKQTQYGC